MSRRSPFDGAASGYMIPAAKASIEAIAEIPSIIKSMNSGVNKLKKSSETKEINNYIKNGFLIYHQSEVSTNDYTLIKKIYNTRKYMSFESALLDLIQESIKLKANILVLLNEDFPKENVKLSAFAGIPVDEKSLLLNQIKDFKTHIQPIESLFLKELDKLDKLKSSGLIDVDEYSVRKEKLKENTNDTKNQILKRIEEIEAKYNSIEATERWKDNTIKKEDDLRESLLNNISSFKFYDENELIILLNKYEPFGYSSAVKEVYDKDNPKNKIFELINTGNNFILSPKENSKIKNTILEEFIKRLKKYKGNEECIIHYQSDNEDIQIFDHTIKFGLNRMYTKNILRIEKRIEKKGFFTKKTIFKLIVEKKGYTVAKENILFKSEEELNNVASIIRKLM